MAFEFSLGQFVLDNKGWIAAVFAVALFVLFIIWWRRRGHNYAPTTILMEFDANGISQPHNVPPEDEGPSFVAFAYGDGSIEFKKKSRIPLSIPDKKGESYDRVYWNPKGSYRCVELEEGFPGYVPPDDRIGKKVSEHQDEFRQIRSGTHSDLLGPKGRLILIGIAVIGLVLGIILDSGLLRIGLR